METIVTFKNVEMLDSIKERAEKKGEKINKFFKDASNLNYTFSKENRTYNVDIILQGSGNVFKASVASSDFILGIDEGVEKIITQIKKYKDKNENPKHSHS